MKNTMTEDPLERIEREEREKKNRNGGLKTATVILAVAALALAGCLAWVWSQKSGLVNELEDERPNCSSSSSTCRATLRT